jgi:hypothetical protein
LAGIYLLFHEFGGNETVDNDLRVRVRVRIRVRVRVRVRVTVRVRVRGGVRVRVRVRVGRRPVSFARTGTRDRWLDCPRQDSSCGQTTPPCQESSGEGEGEGEG